MQKIVSIALGFLFSAFGCLQAQSPSIIGIGGETGAGNFEVRAVDGRTGVFIANENMVNNGTALSLAWARCGRYLAVGGEAGLGNVPLQVFEFDGLSLQEIAGDNLNFDVRGVDWSPDGNFLVVAAGDTTTVYSFNPQAALNNRLTEVANNEDFTNATSASWSSDGTHIAVGDDNPAGPQVRIFAFDGVSTLTQVAMADHDESVNSVDWAPDGVHLAIGGPTADGVEVRVYVFAPNTLTEVATAAHGAEVLSVNWSPTGNLLAIGGVPTMAGIAIRVFEFDGESLAQLASQTDNDVVRSVAWYPDGKNLAAGGDGSDDNDEHIKSYLLDADEGELVETFRVSHGANVNAVDVRDAECFDANVSITNCHALLVNDICPIATDGCSADPQGITRFGGNVSVCGIETGLRVNKISPVDEATCPGEGSNITCFGGAVGVPCMLLTSNIAPIKDCKPDLCGNLCLYGCVTARNDFTVMGHFSRPSDERIKQDITPIDAQDSLAAICALSPQQYEYTQQWQEGTGIEGKQRGFIAQDVACVLPELVHTDAAFDTGNGVMQDLQSIDYSQLVVDLVGGMKALRSEVTALRSALNEQGK